MNALSSLPGECPMECKSMCDKCATHQKQASPMPKPPYIAPGEGSPSPGHGVLQLKHEPVVGTFQSVTVHDSSLTCKD